MTADLAGTVDSIRIDSDEDGFHLLAETVDGEKADLRISNTEVARALVEALRPVQEWVAEHDHEYAAYIAASPAERSRVLGLALRDHLNEEDFDALVEGADLARKREREDA